MSMSSRTRAVVVATVAAVLAATVSMGVGMWTDSALAKESSPGQPAWNDPTGRLDPDTFANPPSTDRPHAFWFWNGKLTRQKLLAQLDKMQAKGVEEFFIHPRQGLGGEFGKSENDYYLSQDYFDKVGFVLREARKRGMKAWLYDDLNWPSGYAGGRTVGGGKVDGRTVPADPDYVPWFLAPRAEDVTGPSTYDEQVPVPDASGTSPDAPQSKLVAALALRKRTDASCDQGGQARGATLDGDSLRDLTGQVRDGHLHWDVPAGDWCLLYLVQQPETYYHPDLEPGVHYVDMLNPAVTRKFIDITHETYYRNFSKYFGSTIQGIFNDEPGFYNNFPGGRGGPASDGSIPWTPGFGDYLEQNAGYDLTRHLASIWYDTGEATTKTRVDYYDALSDRYNEAHTKPLSDWADAHGIALISNPLIEENLGYHKLIEGGSWFEMSKYYQLPGMDLIGGLNTSAITPKLNSSVAHLFGRDRNLAETFGAFGWDLNLDEMHRTIGWEVAAGVDLIDNHAFYYSIRGDRKYESAPSEFFQNLFWPRFQHYADYVGRIIEPARGARPVAPVALLYPSSSVMGSDTPWNAQDALGQVNGSWAATSNLLLAHQQDFDYVDELAIGHDPDMQVGIHVTDDGELAVRDDQAWQALVLPRTTVLSLDAVDTIEDLVKAGGTVVAVDGLPSREAQGHDAELRQRLTALFGTDPTDPHQSRRTNAAGGVAAFLPDRADLPALLARRIDPGIALAPASPDVRVRHVARRGDDGYLVVNLADHVVRTDAVVSDAQTPELWDPETGETRVAPVFRHHDGKTTVPLTLQPYDTVWLAFRPGVHPRGRTPHATASNATVQSVSTGDGGLRARLVVDEPGDVYVKGRFHGQTYAASTEVSDPLAPVRLDGDWTFRFDRKESSAVRRPLGSWTDLDADYSGTGVYTRTFELPDGFTRQGRRITLDLGSVRELASVSVNGSSPRHLDWRPYRLDVTGLLHPGENTVRVRVTNTQANAFQNQSVASGLLGPVTLQPSRVLDLTMRPGAEVRALDLTASADDPLVQPGGTAQVDATVEGVAPGELSGTLSAEGPAGWSVDPESTSYSVTSDGDPVRVDKAVAVTVPEDTPEGTYQVTLTATGDDGDAASATVTLRVSKALAAWEFDRDGDAEGWQPANQLTPFTVRDGVLSTESTGGDPYLTSPTPLAVDLTGGLTVQIEMSTSVGGGGQLFWTTRSSGGFSEDKSTRFTAQAGDQRTYRIPVPATADTLTGLRLDPLTSPGEIHIDSIRVLAAASPDRKAVQ